MLAEDNRLKYMVMNTTRTIISTRTDYRLAATSMLEGGPVNKNVHALSGSRSGADTINILFEVKTRILASGYSELAFD